MAGEVLKPRTNGGPIGLLLDILEPHLLPTHHEPGVSLALEAVRMGLLRADYGPGEEITLTMTPVGHATVHVLHLALKDGWTAADVDAYADRTRSIRFEEPPP